MCWGQPSLAGKLTHVYSAVAGTLVLEWAKLSDYTGNQTYRQLAEKSMRRIGTNACVLCQPAYRLLKRLVL